MNEETNEIPGDFRDFTVQPEIDLSALSVTYWSDQEIGEVYESRLSNLQNKEKWLEENSIRLESAKDEVELAVAKGLISEATPEAVWKYKLRQCEEKEGKVLEVKRELEEKIEEIKSAVVSNLSQFLPSWKPSEVVVNFVVSDKADFCVVGNKIEIDLGKLVNEDDFLNEVKKGITHELFHVWIKDGVEWTNIDLETANGQEVKDFIACKVIDEGLAVLVSDQPLKKHHEEKGRKYEQYKNEASDFFDNFLRSDDKDELLNMKEEGFKDMGYFYVVGHEVVKTILDEVGISGFRELLTEFKKDPKKMFEEYNNIVSDDKKIEF